MIHLTDSILLRHLTRSAVHLLALALFLNACSVPRLAFEDPSIPALHPLAEVVDDSPIAWDVSGEKIVVAHRGLVLVDVGSGKSRRLTSETPQLLAWEGSLLAAVYPEEGTSRLVLFDASGSQLTEHEVEGMIVALAANKDSTIYALVSRSARYSFGTNQKLLLLTLQQDGSLQLLQLADLTLDRSTPGLVSNFPFGPLLEMSPLGDELIYSRLYDPPAFDPRYRVIVRHLSTGVERLIGEFPLRGGVARLLPDGENVLISDGLTSLQQISLWGDERHALSYQGVEHIDAVTELLYVDGSLYRGAELLWRINHAPEATFSPDGSKVALISGGHLYVHKVAAPTPFGAVSAERLRLRRLRVLGLIERDEYRRYSGE